jgi:hypothetical protein
MNENSGLGEYLFQKQWIDSWQESQKNKQKRKAEVEGIFKTQIENIIFGHEFLFNGVSIPATKLSKKNLTSSDLVFFAVSFLVNGWNAHRDMCKHTMNMNINRIANIEVSDIDYNQKTFNMKIVWDNY